MLEQANVGCGASGAVKSRYEDYVALNPRRVDDYGVPELFDETASLEADRHVFYKIMEGMTLKFSVSIEAVYAGKDFVKSMVEVKRAGFNAFEFWIWWEKDLYAIKAAKEALQLTLASIVTKFISLTDPSKRQEYMEGLRQTIAVAQMLGMQAHYFAGRTRIAGRPQRGTAPQHCRRAEGMRAYAEAGGNDAGDRTA